ncbi:hypothetical protein HZH68_000795 [Vespula germanica]|uniref:Uncharacterized protein n=2 Tax=Vespula TaxID=7451 RepID=A0A834U6C6_VESGE|nr:uncharacterized protein LOC127061411 [Vespula vulgaris]KAF7411835.1 hypothetical protein HZH66_000731 [Vespula vulgaris]KAF7418142.1 hypothetical protein HZH68_000795 [Vespula germanica]
MEDTIDQDLAQIDPLVEPLTRKEMEWFENNKQVELNQRQPQTQSSYFQSTNFNETTSNTQWWKNSPITSMDLLSEHQDTSSITTFPLLSDQVSIPSPSDVVQEIELSNKKPIKSKELKTEKRNKDSVQRAKHPERWKVNIKKNARLRGEQYVGVGGKIVPAKTMGPPCNCRMRCSEKVDEQAREELHKVFWKTCTWEQRKQYIALSVKESPKQRTRCRGNVKAEERRQVTFTYSLLLKGEFITVCKCMFLSTFSVSEKFVRHAMDKKRSSPGGIIGPDQRGRHTPKTKKSEAVKERIREHIKSFPIERSINPKDGNEKKYLDSRLSIAAMHKLYVLKCQEEGVPESDIVKESYYREMFKTEFDLCFKRTKTKDKKFIPNITDSKTKINN